MGQQWRNQHKNDFKQTKQRAGENAYRMPWHDRERASEYINVHGTIKTYNYNIEICIRFYSLLVKLVRNNNNNSNKSGAHSNEPNNTIPHTRTHRWRRSRRWQIQETAIWHWYTALIEVPALLVCSSLCVCAVSPSLCVCLVGWMMLRCVALHAHLTSVAVVVRLGCVVWPYTSRMKHEPTIWWWIHSIHFGVNVCVSVCIAHGNGLVRLYLLFIG